MQADPLPSHTHIAIEPVAATVSPEVSIETAIAQMSDAQSSYVLITQQQRPVGIFTEQDLVKLIASTQIIAEQPISTAMTPIPKTIQADDVEDAFSLYHQMQRHQLRYLPVVANESEQLVGVVTHNSLLKALTSAKASSQAKQQANQTNSFNRSRAFLQSQVASQTAELYQAEHRWRTLLENVQLVVIGLDIRGKVTYANPFFLALTGYTAEEMKKADWFRYFIPHKEHSAMTHYLQQLHLDRDVPLQYQNTILTKSGEERSIVWNNTVLRDSDDQVIGTMSIGEDITERFAVEHIKGEFISMVSHELRTPLTAIHGGVRLLSQGIVPSESAPGKALLQVVAKSSERLARLIDDILELERLESNEQPLHKQWLNTQSLTHQVTKTFEVMAGQAKIAIDVCDPGIQLLADSDRISQLLENLIDNAIKFSPAASAVRLTVEAQGSFSNHAGKSTDSGANSTANSKSSVLFTVCDQGRGIPPEKCEHIFDRFVQVNQTDNSDKGGTGLGLTICRKIVEQHGGKIWVESTPGEGSCFSFTLPNFVRSSVKGLEQRAQNKGLRTSGR
ncbi:MAG: ATP-binding protein [Cyanobacteria bacterium J06581_3]